VFSLGGKVVGASRPSICVLIINDDSYFLTNKFFEMIIDLAKIRGELYRCVEIG
jgi:hypothetical protein